MASTEAVTVRSAAGLFLALTLGTLFVLGQALAHGCSLLGVDLVVFAQLDFLGVVLRAAPDAVAANQHVHATVQAQLVHDVPATLFAALALSPAAAHAANFDAIHIKASRPQLIEHIIVVLRHGQ